MHGQSDGSPTITILTPTYNRAALLPRLYASLVESDYGPLEWVIVDDGSVDGTKSTVDQFIEDGKISIVYIKKENGGVHTAMNAGYKLTKGELVFVVGSDDWVAPGGIKYIVEEWGRIAPNDREKYVGITALIMNPDGRAIGDSFLEPLKDGCHTDLRINAQLRGDKSEILRGELVRNHILPEFPGEREMPFLTLLTMFSLRGLLVRPLNKVVKVVDYQKDGLSSRKWSDVRRDSPRGFALMDTYRLREGRLHIKHRVAIILTAIADGTWMRISPWVLLLQLYHVPRGVLHHIYRRIKGRQLG